MTIFLSAKQIVDLLYQFKFLDYLMVVAAAGLVVYKTIKEYKASEENGFASFTVKVVKGHFCLSDALILILAILTGLSLLRNLDGFSEACAIESAFLVYLLGRVYGKEVLKAGKYLAYVGYAIIYVNGSYYLYKCIDYYTHNEYPWPGEGDLKNSGALYYYKTDLGIAIVIATIFIYCFSKALIAKYVTIFLVNTFFLFNTYAHTSQGIYIILLIIICGIEITKKIKKSKRNTWDSETNGEYELNTAYQKGENTESNSKWHKAVKVCTVICMLFIFIFICALHFSPVRQMPYHMLNVPKETEDKIENIFHSRHLILWDTFHFMMNDSPVTELIGKDLDGESFSEHNSRGMMAHSMYLTMIYGTGTVGIAVLIMFIWSVIYKIIDITNKNTVTRFLIITMFIMFLIMGLTTDAIEYTQMSWFPFIFAGAGMTIAGNKNESV